MRDKLSHT